MSIKRPTSFDVARAAGVSRSVVSAVINSTPGIGVSEITRERVLKAIKDLNYQVDAQARAMKTGLSRCLAAFGDMNNPLFLQVLEGMQKACAQRGYHVLISGRSSEDEDRYALLDLFRQRRIDGIISLDETNYENQAWLEGIHSAKAPYASIEGYADSDSVTSILTDYRQSIRDALAYMGGSQLSYPIYIEAYNEKPGQNWAEQHRKDAYVVWCRSKGLAPVIHELQSEDEEGIYHFLLSLKNCGNPIPPILLNWSVCATLFYRAAWKLELRIGKDLLLMAADNTNRSNAYLTPALSSVEIPYAAMGELAVQSLFEQLDNNVYLPLKKWLRASVIPGESVASVVSG